LALYLASSPAETSRFEEIVASESKSIDTRNKTDANFGLFSMNYLGRQFWWETAWLFRWKGRASGVVYWSLRVLTGMVGVVLAPLCWAADADSGWSQDLLSRLLATPEQTREMSNRTVDAMILRSYQLRVLRLGEPGRATHLVNILRRMLPPDSRVTEDKPANTLHLFSTMAAQDAAWEFISAMDSESDAAPRTDSTIPVEIRKALENLASARTDSETLLKIVEEANRGTEQRVTEALRQSEARARSAANETIILGVTIGVGAIALLLGVLFFGLRRSQRSGIAAAVTETRSTALLPMQGMESVLAVSRDQHERTKELQKLMETLSIAYQADRQRNGMMLETVAKKHGEISATLDELAKLRDGLGEKAAQAFMEVNRAAVDQLVQHASTALEAKAHEVGLIAEAASRKMDETANRLEVQNLRTEVLAQELERTQREVDALFEKLRVAQEAAQQAQIEANEQRRIATEKTSELARKEAALAGLSLLMQEPVDAILETVGNPQPRSNMESGVPLQESSVSPLEPGAEMMEPPNGHPNDAHDAPDSECPPHKYTYRISPVASN
jgi:hypothetical protein